MKGFIEFVREKGVVGLAVGFILGGAISKLISALVNDLVNPLVGLLLGFAKGIETASLKIGGAMFQWGHFISAVIDFITIAFVVYYSVKILRLDKIDKKK